MLIASGAEVVENGRRGCGCLTAAGSLAVQRPERVGHISASAVVAQGIQPVVKELPQFLPVSRPAFVAAERVDLQTRFSQAQLREKMAQHGEYLGVNLRIRDTCHFDPDLVELAIAPFLGPFVPEHGPQVIEFGNRVRDMELVLYE